MMLNSLAVIITQLATWLTMHETRKVNAVNERCGQIFSLGHATLHLAVSFFPFVYPSVTFSKCERFLLYCPCPTIQDCGAEYPPLFFLFFFANLYISVERPYFLVNLSFPLFFSFTGLSNCNWYQWLKYRVCSNHWSLCMYLSTRVLGLANSLIAFKVTKYIKRCFHEDSVIWCTSLHVFQYFTRRWDKRQAFLRLFLKHRTSTFITRKHVASQHQNIPDFSTRECD